MSRKIQIPVFGLILLLALTASVMASANREIRLLPEPQTVQSPATRAACTLAKTNYTAGTVFIAYEAGYGTYTYFNPALCGSPTYPFEITSFSFTLYDWAAGTVVWPAMVDVVVYEAESPGDSCLGPRAELCRFSVTADQATFGFPSMGTVNFPSPCCVNGPFFIGLEYTAGAAGTTPSVLFDNNPSPVPCDNWMRDLAGVSVEWYTFWSPPVQGYPIFDVNGDTQSPNCGTDCTWNPGDPHKMHYPQLPDEAGWDVNATYPMILADDWMCSETGWIKDLHWWGSWKYGETGEILNFILSFHTDIPADQSPTGYSMPGETIMEFEIPGMPGTPIDPPTSEGWYDPSTGEVLYPDHQEYFQYDYCLDPTQWLWQDSGTIYWVNISAIVAGGGTTYIPGDVNGDGLVYQADVDYLQDYLFSGGPPPVYDVGGFYPAADVNGDCVVNSVDLAALASYVTTGAPPLTYCPQYPPTSAGHQWGWKSSLDHFNDDAVWAMAGALDWIEMYEPGSSAGPITNLFDASMDPNGNFLGGSGTDYYGQGWYQYPTYNWWNIWFYDHPFDYTRYKTIHIEFDVDWMEPGTAAQFTLAVNWSTDVWSEIQPPSDSAPPLPGDVTPSNEDLYIGRHIFVDSTGDFGGHYVIDWVLPDYNPEWVSIDIRGYNFVITNGSITHDCRGEPVSLDLSFVVTGDPGTQEQYGACCYTDAAGFDDCIITTQDSCVNYFLGSYQGDGTDCGTVQACCLPDGSCITIDSICCVTDLGGVPQGAGTACTTPVACCFPDGTCANLDPLCCVDQGGTPYLAAQCTELQACCFPDGTCSDLDPLCCTQQGGTPQGPGTQCGTPEACCFSDGSCVTIDPLCCTQQGGTPQGAGTQCGAAAQACCFIDGSCLTIDSLCCVSLGGDPQGAGTACLGDNDGDGHDDACQPAADGACCFADGSCLQMTAFDCGAAGGIYKGDGSVCLGDNNGNGVDDACESWNPGDAHKMHYPQLPDTIGWDVNASWPLVLADDWMCSETGWVKDIHFWGSWYYGQTGTILSFTLSIHADIPAGSGGTGHSTPGDLLWEKTITQFNATAKIHETFEGYYDPYGQIVLPDNHQEYFQYDVYLDSLDWFYQDSGTIYWLDISANVENPTSPGRWGWKSSVNHWNDDAVWGFDDTPPVVTPAPDLPGPYPYAFPNDKPKISEGLPPGATIEIDVTFDVFFDVVYTTNGYSDGDKLTFKANLAMPMEGTGALSGFVRNLSSQADFELKLPPGGPPSVPMTFMVEILSMSLSSGPIFGDPDFDMFDIKMGSNHSLPSPGTITLRRLPTGNWSVDSFFDVVYRIDFQGAPGSNLDGMSGSTTDSTEMKAGGHNVDVWTDLWEPPNFDTSLDLAFVITGDPGEFICDCVPGNANGDAFTNIFDVTYLITFLYNGGPEPTPYALCSGDPNCDCVVNIFDVTFLISYLYKGGPPPCDCLAWLANCGPPLQ